MRISRCSAVAIAVVGATALLVLPFSARADIDISLPPGPPMRWTWELPQRLPLPYSSAARPKGPPPAAGGKTTRSRRDVRDARTTARRPDGRGVQSTPRAGTPYTPFETSGVLTQDLLGELPWARRQPNERPLRYPPPVTDDVYWFAQAMLLRMLLYPGLASGEEGGATSRSSAIPRGRRQPTLRRSNACCFGSPPAS